MLNVKDVNFKYPKSRNYALKEINFEVNDGEFIVIVGPSGSSKSTLLKLLKPQLELNGEFFGEITYKGNPLKEAKFNEIAYLGQDIDEQIISNRVNEELAFGLERLGLSAPQIRAKTAETCEFFNIGQIFNEKINDLSGGQKQILSLASIFALNPSLILLDEPLTHLDQKGKEMFLNILRKVNRNLGASVIIAEQNLQNICDMTDRIIFMREGCLKFDLARDLAFLNMQRKGDGDYLSTQTQAGYLLGKDSPILSVKDARNFLKLKSANSQISLKSENRQSKTSPKSEAVVIKVKDCSFRYEKDRQNVVQNCNLNIIEGEITSIVGSNGSGKSTLLKLMAGIYKPIWGKVKKALGVKIAYLPQQVKSMFLSNSVQEELARTIEADSMNCKSIAALMRLANLERIKTQNPFDLSGGEMQRLALSKVFLSGADIYLLDEPMSGLDPRFKRLLGDMLLKLSSLRKTIVIVSHDLEFCSQYTHKCGVMFDKKVIGLQNTRDFFTSNSFYTTNARLIARDIVQDIVNQKELLKFCRDLNKNQIEI